MMEAVFGVGKDFIRERDVSIWKQRS